MVHVSKKSNHASERDRPLVAAFPEILSSQRLASGVLAVMAAYIQEHNLYEMAGVASREEFAEKHGIEDATLSTWITAGKVAIRIYKEGWHLARQEPEPASPEAVDIASWVTKPGVLYQFGCRKRIPHARSASSGKAGAVRIDKRGNAEIEHSAVALDGHQIARLDVAVDDVFRVGVPERVSHELKEWKYEVGIGSAERLTRSVEVVTEKALH